MGKYDHFKNQRLSYVNGHVKKASLVSDDDSFQLNRTIINSNRQQKRSIDARDMIKRKHQTSNDKQNLLLNIVNDNVNSRDETITKRINTISGRIIENAGENTIVSIKNTSKQTQERKVNSLGFRENFNIQVKNDLIGAGGINIFKKQIEKLQTVESESDNIKIRVLNDLATKNKQEAENDEMEVDVIREKDDEKRDYEEYIKQKKSQVVTQPTHVQGYRLLVTNLPTSVTEDDLLELFSGFGAIKRAKFLEPGTADVVFVKLEDARQAIEQLNNSQLDGKQISVDLVTKIPISEKLVSSLKNPSVSKPVSLEQNHLIKKTIQNEPSQIKPSVNAVTTLSKKFSTTQKEAIKLPQTKTQNEETSKITVDPSVIHQALFKANKSSNTSNPVTFTVKL